MLWQSRDFQVLVLTLIPFAANLKTTQC